MLTRGDIMAKKFKMLACLSVISIIIIGCSALSIISGRHIDSVKSVNMTANTSSSISLCWQPVSKAEGYRIYIKNNGSDNFDLYQEIIGGDTNSFELQDLESAQVDDVKITAFKYYSDELYESNAADQITVYTLPDKVNQRAESHEEGVLSIRWDTQKNVSGYELQYAEDNEFYKPVTETVNDSEAAEFTVDGLKPESVFYTKIRAYINVNKDRVYGEWSDTAEIKVYKKYVMEGELDPDKPMVALSFDDGPGYAYEDNENPTKQILDVLEEYGARATFFMCASRIGGENEECLKRELELGCELGNHTYNHKNYGKKVTCEDISRCSDRIKEKCGSAPTIFRCPGGIMSSKIIEECKSEGMPIAYWSIDTEDWKSKDPDSIYDIATSRVYDGAIILMHDIYPTTAEAVKKLVPKLIADGYQVVGVTEMLEAKTGGKLEAGQQYVDYRTINNNT